MYIVGKYKKMGKSMVLILLELFVINIAFLLHNRKGDGLYFPKHPKVSKLIHTNISKMYFEVRYLTNFGNFEILRILCNSYCKSSQIVEYHQKSSKIVKNHQKSIENVPGTSLETQFSEYFCQPISIFLDVFKSRMHPLYNGAKKHLHGFQKVFQMPVAKKTFFLRDHVIQTTSHFKVRLKGEGTRPVTYFRFSGPPLSH